MGLRATHVEAGRELMGRVWTRVRTPAMEGPDHRIQARDRYRNAWSTSPSQTTLDEPPSMDEASSLQTIGCDEGFFI